MVDGKLAELCNRSGRVGLELDRELSIAAARKVEPNAARVAELKRELEAIAAEAAPLEAEWNAARWTRWYPCLNKGGHIHVTLGCSSLEHDTRMGWATDLSGRAVADVVAEYGTDVCSVCVPEAPALPQPVYGSKQQQEREAARLVRAEKKAAKDAKVAANTLVAPVADMHGHTVRTVFDAKRELKSDMPYALNLHAGKSFREGLHEDAVASVARMVEALTLKLGAEAVAVLVAKAEKAARKEWSR